MNFTPSPTRGPAVAASAMVATSQPTATMAALEMLRRGGNAVDAALTAAAVLCVAEPMSTGLGGDAFAIVAEGGQLHGLDAAGPAPVSAPVLPVQADGAASVVVPGAVRGWAALSERFGRLGLDTILAPAIDLARTGTVAGYNCASEWQHATRAPREFGAAPRLGERFRLPGLAETLQLIASDGPDAFYTGRIARAIVAASWLEERDLSDYTDSSWVEPLSVTYRGVEVFELPPPTQGVAALEGLALLATAGSSLPEQVRAVALALEDARRFVRDGADVRPLLDAEHIATRVGQTPVMAPEPRGGTVYLCVVDDDGMAVSFIQSIFENFGSGVVAPGTGVVLNNRAACFEVDGQVHPGRRPYHTIIPGMLQLDGRLRGPFGVMGGFIQAQAHVQFVSAVVDEGLDPQAALDRPRFRLDRGALRVEEGLRDRVDELVGAGYDVVVDPDRSTFGGGQAVLVGDGHLQGGSDARKDGFAAGF